MRGLAWTVAGLAVLSLGVGYAWKDQCTYTEWVDDWQYRHYCYSDVLPLWFGKHLDRDAIPYAEEFNEYPVLTAMFMWAMAAATPDGDLRTYMEASFATLSVLGALATFALWKLGMPPARIVAWAAAPALVIHGLTNWDLLAVALAACGWWAWRSRRPFTAALLLGLGGAAKLYPAFFLPFLLVAAWGQGGREGRGAAGRVLAGGFVGLGLTNLLVALMAPPESWDRWFEMWRFQADRSPDFETPWAAVLQPFFKWWHPSLGSPEGWTLAAAWVGTAAMALSLAWLALRVHRHRLDPLAAGGLLTLVFLLVNKVYSPQYTLWALPILLLLQARWLPLWIFTAADVANFFIRYNYISNTDWHPEWEPWSRLAVAVRWLALAWATWTLARRYGIFGRGQAEEGAAPRPTEPQRPQRPAEA